MGKGSCRSRKGKSRCGRRSRRGRKGLKRRRIWSRSVGRKGGQGFRRIALRVCGGG